jgi:hypothetical protein
MTVLFITWLLCHFFVRAPQNQPSCLLMTLQQAKHKIITGFGVSKMCYGSDLVPLAQGMGQGDGFAPTGWAFISTPLINMMRTAGFGLQILMGILTILITSFCYTFVDDTDLIHTGSSIYTPSHEMAQDMQRFITNWEGGLRATGGALRVNKSFWYLIGFVWKNH